ncbi:uncharacterized protein EV422DRAFT_47932 [Fimicolochytrium jonesii]|uniref:uncharacterized protein n=1 Tax=Fimicolochytrium jonesii TaxID=1396493 RepID=UPI0022FEFFDB|nr:uncharacterized protein EV422DRAFT_47932 [Fimicolochytrium jonesii]KAI8820976.1 hypothetical protein EV422DRAFT_47932 [Fimicolochytrium jonesii]
MPKPRHTGAHVCPLCLFLCPTKTSLTKHLDDVCFCPLPKRTCSQCRRVHKAAADLITCLHEENPDTETIPCCVKNCKIEASSVTEFAHHYRQKHGRDAPLYENSAISSTTSSGVFPPPRIGAAAAKLARATSQESAPVPPGTPSQPNRNDFRAYGSPMRVVEEHTPPAIAPFTFPQHRRLVLDGKLIDVVLRLEE